MSETTGGGAAAKVRWGILGTASITRGQFLPGLRETGDGQAVIVGSRDRERGEAFAAAEGVDRVTESLERGLLAGAQHVTDVSPGLPGEPGTVDGCLQSRLGRS